MFTEVLVGVDGGQGGRDAIALTAQLAAPGASLTLANVFQAEHERPGRPGLNRSQRHRASHAMLRLARDTASIDAKLVALNASSVAPALHGLAERRGCDLLVIGSYHRGAVERIVHGDDRTDLLTGAPCAVAVAPAGYAANHRPLSRLGVGFDGSPEARAALGAARHLAARGGSAIKALFVLPLQSRPYGDPIAHRWPDVAQQIAEDDRHRFDDLESVDAEVRYGRPHEELERFSEALDLLIVGSRSQGALRRMVTGSTSNHLARRPRCPLLVLPRRATGAPNPAAPASLTTQRQNSPTP